MHYACPPEMGWSIVDDSARYVAASPAVALACGHPNDPLCGADLGDVWAPPMVNALMRRNEIALRERRPVRAIVPVLPRHNGHTVRWADSVATPDGSIVQVRIAEITASVQLAALRLLLNHTGWQSAPSPLPEVPDGVLNVLVDGGNLRDIVAVSGQHVDDVLALLARLAH